MAPHRAMRRGGRDWPTGERTQMAAVRSSSMSPLRNGELAPQDEWTHTARDEHAMNGSEGSAGSRRQDRRCSRSVTSASGRRDFNCCMTAHCAADASAAFETDDLELRRRHDDVGAARDAPKMRLEPRGAVQWIAWLRHRGERLVGERFDDFRRWQQSRCVAAALVLGAVRRDPLRDDTRLLLVQREVLGAALDVLVPRARRSARKRRYASRGRSRAGPTSIAASNITRPVDVAMKQRVAWGRDAPSRAARIAKEVAGDLRARRSRYDSRESARADRNSRSSSWFSAASSNRSSRVGGALYTGGPSCRTTWSSMRSKRGWSFKRA